MEKVPHPLDPQSNVAKFSGYHPDKYILDNISLTIRTDESIAPGQPPRLTQQTVGKFLQPLTRELVEVPPRPTIDELPDAVIEKMVEKDKAFWVDKPGANAYTLHDAYYNYGMTTEMVKQPHQDAFPRSYQYDLDCIKYRRLHACDGLGQSKAEQKPIGAHCRECRKASKMKKTSRGGEEAVKRWKYYPDVTTSLTAEEIRDMMKDSPNAQTDIQGRRKCLPDIKATGSPLLSQNTIKDHFMAALLRMVVATQSKHNDILRLRYKSVGKTELDGLLEMKPAIGIIRIIQRYSITVYCVNLQNESL